MLLGPVRTHLTTWAGNSDCIAKINSRGEMRAGAGLGKLGGWCRLLGMESWSSSLQQPPATLEGKFKYSRNWWPGGQL